MPVLAIVIALHVGLILLLLLLAPPLPKGKPGITSMVAVMSPPPTAQRAQPKPQQQKRAEKAPSNPQPKPMVTVDDAPPAKWSFGDPALKDFDLSKVPSADSAPAQMAESRPARQRSGGRRAGWQQAVRRRMAA